MFVRVLFVPLSIALCLTLSRVAIGDDSADARLDQYEARIDRLERIAEKLSECTANLATAAREKTAPDDRSARTTDRQQSLPETGRVEIQIKTFGKSSASVRVEVCRSL
jgi:hypothetical protein